MVTMGGLLIGVKHSNPDLLERVVATLLDAKPRNVALELPEDYLVKRDIEITTPFFDELAQRLEEEGIEVIPLEDPLAYEFHQALNYALGVAKGLISKEEIKRRIEDVSIFSGYTRPEVLERKVYAKYIYTMALEILKISSSVQGTRQLEEVSARHRERYGLRKIINNILRHVVVGDSHAHHMQYNLPNYRYIKIT